VRESEREKVRERARERERKRGWVGVSGRGCESGCGSGDGNWCSVGVFVRTDIECLSICLASRTSVSLRRG